MEAHQQVAASARDNQAFALMSRLHVILRRQTQRITDIEYMRISPAYCRHVLDLAAQTSLPDVADICTKLEELCFGHDGLFVSAPEKAAAKGNAANANATGGAAKSSTQTADAAHTDAQPVATYVGRLR
jgi:hypothetical protein